MKRRLKDLSKVTLYKLFEHGQRVGFDVLPRHFYSEIPTIHQLRESTHWKVPYSMVGVNGVAIEDQISFIRDCCSPAVIDNVKTMSIHAEASRQNGEDGFGLVEADLLFAFVATKKPRQIFQIGCGVSTAICLLAAEFGGYSPELICVEPYPTKYLVELADKGKISLKRSKVEVLDLEIISSLSNDVLFFVDSTHTLGPAGEVSRIILEMLPRLKPGASVHFHDITFPYDYDRHILESALFFQHESVLLHAFLAYNSRFRISASLSMLHYFKPELLAEYLPNYRPAKNNQGLSASDGHFPSSTYLQVVG